MSKKKTKVKEKLHKKKAMPAQKKPDRSRILIPVLAALVLTSAVTMFSIPRPQNSAETFIEKYQDVNQAKYSTYRT